MLIIRALSTSVFATNLVEIKWGSNIDEDQKYCIDIADGKR